jgi:ribosome-associated protein
VDAGGEVKDYLAEVPVLVNGAPEARRGRQLHPGDVVTTGGEHFHLVRGTP